MVGECGVSSPCIIGKTGELLLSDDEMLIAGDRMGVAGMVGAWLVLLTRFMNGGSCCTELGRRSTEVLVTGVQSAISGKGALALASMPLVVAGTDMIGSNSMSMTWAVSLLGEADRLTTLEWCMQALCRNLLQFTLLRHDISTELILCLSNRISSGKFKL